MKLNDNQVTFRYHGQQYVSDAATKAALVATKSDDLAAAVQQALDEKRAEKVIHKFEAAGLGIAPFHVVGFDIVKYVACPGAPAQPGSTCDFCGQAIMNVFYIADKNNKRFKVGCDCVNKTGDEGLKKESKTHPDVLKHRRVLEAEKARVVFETLKDLIERNRALYASQPHPLGYYDRRTGKPANRLDQIEWLFHRSGRTGRARLLNSLLRENSDLA